MNKVLIAILVLVWEDREYESYLGTIRSSPPCTVQELQYHLAYHIGTP